jgi:pantothenate kinase
MLDRDGWRDCAEMMDLRVWVDCEREVCRTRTIERNFAAGIVATRAECAERGGSRSHQGRGADLQSINRI